MERVSGTGSADLIAAVERLVETGSRYFLIDAPDDVVAEVAAGTRDHGIALFNTTATGDALRSELCQPHLFHTAASRTMLTDALAQYLVSRKWNEVLVLQGPTAARQGDRGRPRTLIGFVRSRNHCHSRFRSR